MNPTDALEPLAVCVYACELAGLAVGEVPQEVMESAQAGEGFELRLEITDEQDLLLAFDAKSLQLQAQVHWLDGDRQLQSVLSALQLNHEMPPGRRRFSMEMFSGSIVLSDTFDWADCAADTLALGICEMMLLMDTLIDQGGVPLRDERADTPAQRDEPKPDSLMNLGLRV